MLDTMTLTKVVGAVCGTFLVFLLGKWAAEEIYHVGGGGHGEEEVAGYAIEVPDTPAGGGAEAEVPFEEVFASADAGAGERVFGKCRACHKLDGTDGTGPHLNGVVGREVASVAGFGYSGNLKPVADVWSPENLNGFLENPKGYAPGTTMGFAGLRSVEDRANIIAYLQTTDG